jgi:ParB family chromosome partitioning protein
MQQLQTIPVEKIDVGDGFNSRRNLTLDDGFVASIRAHGVIQPILVHPQGTGEHQRFFLVAGERRFRAAQEIGLADIPAVVRTTFGENGEALPVALVENLQREQLSPIEEATGDDVFDV